MGSRVPAWPILRIPNRLRQMETTSWLVIPEGLSINSNPLVFESRPPTRRGYQLPGSKIPAMRIGVIGAGAVGGTIAALLDRGGHEVEITARGEHLAAIRQGGLSLEGAWGTHTAKVEANPILTAVPDLLLLTTKALDAQTALEENSKLIDGVPLVVVQNGLDGLRIASQVLPSSTPVGALAVFAASYLAPGSVAVTTPGSTYLGSASNGPEVKFAAGVLEKVMPVKVLRNFPGAQWTKLLVNQINALPAITGLSAQETISIRGLRFVLTRSLKEAARIGFKTGIRFASLQGLSNPLLRLYCWLPDWIAQLLPLLMQLRMGKRPNPGSTLQSILRGQPTEIDFLNGAIVSAANAQGLKAPINAELVNLVHEVEASGRFYSAQEVTARIGIAAGS